jgi:hypothetical protein
VEEHVISYSLALSLQNLEAPVVNTEDAGLSSAPPTAGSAVADTRNESGMPL